VVYVVVNGSFFGGSGAGFCGGVASGGFWC